MPPIVLAILDGWGIAPPNPGNAVHLADTPCFDSLWAAYPRTQLGASGEAVGLPKDEDGNSEAGHLNLGAGKVIYQSLPRISLSIADGSFLRNEALAAACRHALEKKSRLHLMGVIGGEVHASREHLYAILWLCRQCGFEDGQIKIHAFTDGRDTPPQSAPTFISEVIHKTESMGVGEIATVSGRYFAMDRDRRWGRTEKAYRALVEGVGPAFKDPLEAIESAYQEGVNDEFIPPSIITNGDGSPRGLIANDDAVIFFNFRSDRTRQLTKALIAPTFQPFEREKVLPDLFFVTMTEYEEGLPVSAIAFPPRKVENPLARVLADHGKRQLHIAETEKYPHVTFFFNGEREDPFTGEDRVLIPSPKVATYDKKPEMSAREITDVVQKKIGSYDFVLINFANPDMVGHTGVLKAGVKAVEVTDSCLSIVTKAAQSLGGACLVTADHGNVEEMIEPQTGEVDTKHSTNPVPFIAVGSQDLVGPRRKLTAGALSDVAPTILSLMQLPKPPEMTGKNLLTA